MARTEEAIEAYYVIRDDLDGYGIRTVIRWDFLNDVFLTHVFVKRPGASKEEKVKSRRLEVGTTKEAAIALGEFIAREAVAKMRRTTLHH